MGGKTIRVSGFPMNVTADEVKNFLEKYTGDESVFALKVRHPAGAATVRSRAYAIVQFLTTIEAELICNKAKAQQQLFSYEGSNLKVGYEEHDIVPKPRKPIFVLEDIELHLGCLISENKLGVLWNCKEVKVHFGFNKIWFFLSHGSRSYRLDLSDESIWEIKLHLPPHGCSKFLVIQVCFCSSSMKLAQVNDIFAPSIIFKFLVPPFK